MTKGQKESDDRKTGKPLLTWVDLTRDGGLAGPVSLDSRKFLTGSQISDGSYSLDRPNSYKDTTSSTGLPKPMIIENPTFIFIIVNPLPGLKPRALDRFSPNFVLTKLEL